MKINKYKEKYSKKVLVIGAILIVLALILSAINSFEKQESTPLEQSFAIEGQIGSGVQANVSRLEESKRALEIKSVDKEKKPRRAIKSLAEVTLLKTRLSLNKNERNALDIINEDKSIVVANGDEYNRVLIEVLIPLSEKLGGNTLQEEIQKYFKGERGPVNLEELLRDQISKQ